MHEEDSLQIDAWLIIVEIMVYFFTSIVQCMLLLIDRRIMVYINASALAKLSS